jgi:hypothetical protein
MFKNLWASSKEHVDLQILKEFDIRFIAVNLSEI